MRARARAWVLALLAGCTAPDVGADLAAGRALLGAIGSGAGPALQTAAAAEFRAAEDALIRQGEPVVASLGACDPFADPPAADPVSDCRVVSLVPASGVADAASTRAFLAMLDTYLEALTQLAGASSVEAARRQADALVAAFGQPGPGQPAAFEQIARSVRARRALIVEGTGFALDQGRIMALRRAIRAAGPVVAEGVPVAAAYLEILDPRLERAHEARLAAWVEAEAAQAAADPQRTRAAVDALRRTTAELVAAQAASPAVRLRSFGEVHARMVRTLRRPGALPRIAALLEQLRRLRESLP